MLKYLLNLKNIILFIIVGIMANIILALSFQMYSYVTDITINRNISKVPTITTLAILLVLGLFCFFSLLDYFKWLIVVYASKKLKDDIMTKVFMYDYEKFYKGKKSYYSSILLNDVEIIEENFFTKVVEILAECIQMCVMIMFISFIEWRFMPIILLFALPSILHPFILRSKLGKAGYKISSIFEKYTLAVREYIENFEIIKIFQKEKIFVAKFTKVVSDLEKARKKQHLINSTNMAMLLFAMYFLKIGLALFFVSSALKGIITLAAVMALFGFANQIGNPISEILGYIADISESSEVRKKLTIFLSTDEDVEGLEKLIDINFKCEIKFENVWFTYPNQSETVLENFSIFFQKGKKYLLLGEIGSGKSTILRLLAGYYFNYDGSITFDSYELKNVDSKVIRDKIALINQDTFVFSGTIRDNITLYDTRYSDQQIVEAMKLAGLEAFFSSLSNGLDTFVFESGVNLSGGEKQRISVARAILVNKEIFLVDEGSSQLDNITSLEIERNLLSTTKTVIIISHRIDETITEYDGIGILVNKRLAAFGNYDELRNTNIFNNYMGIN